MSPTTRRPSTGPVGVWTDGVACSDDVGSANHVGEAADTRGRLDRQSVRGLRRPQRGHGGRLHRLRPRGRVRPPRPGAQDAPRRVPARRQAGHAVRHRDRDVDQARPPPQHRAGPLRPGDRGHAVRRAGAGDRGRPQALARHLAVEPAAGAPVRHPVLPGDGTRLAQGAVLPPRHQAREPPDHRRGDAQDHRLRPGQGPRREDPATRTMRPHPRGRRGGPRPGRDMVRLDGSGRRRDGPRRDELRRGRGTAPRSLGPRPGRTGHRRDAGSDVGIAPRWGRPAADARRSA